jgi:hypothetical protein
MLTAQVQRDVTQPSTRSVPVGTSTIVGTVVDAETGRPVVGARVTVSGETPPVAGRGTGPVPTRGGGPGVVTGISVALVNQVSPAGGRVSRSAVADAQGGFEVRHLPAGRYSVTVNHRAYLNGSVGQKKPAGPGTPFQVADGTKTSLTVKMIRGGVLTGAVYGEHGEPIPYAQVSVYRYSSNMGVRRLQATSGVSTDDRGVYRLHGLQPGEYFVAASHNDNYPETSAGEMALIDQAVASGAVKQPAAPGLPATVSVPVSSPTSMSPFNQPPGYLPTFFPSATSPATARSIRIAGGDEHTSMDISVRLIAASNIEGVITNPPGSDMRVQMQLMSDDPNFVNRGGAQVRPDGNFLINNVPPGTYTLAATTFPVRPVPGGPLGGVYPLNAETPSDPPALWGRVLVSVSGEPRVLTSMTLQAGRTVSGRVAFEMARPPDLTQQNVTVRLSHAPGSNVMGGNQLSARVEPDGRFTIRGVGPGRYIVNVNGPFTRSAVINGQDVMDIPLDFDAGADVSNALVTVTDQVSELSGTFTLTEGANPGDFMVLVVSTDERYWLPGSRRIVIAGLNQTGAYRVRGLPAGSYFIAVLTDFEQGRQYDPAFLKELMSTPGVHLTIADGEKVTRDLRATGR